MQCIRTVRNPDQPLQALNKTYPVKIVPEPDCRVWIANSASRIGKDRNGFSLQTPNQSCFAQISSICPDEIFCPARNAFYHLRLHFLTA